MSNPYKNKLSIVIVNYNVEYFLEQCLNSVLIATQNIQAEIIVVDNNSIDGSVEMVQDKFSSVKLIANKENVGFSKANNQAIEASNAEYVLLLNPDTVVEEETFTKIIAFMDAHPKAGGLGVRMLDGKGKFLPESKRGLPTPSVAFYKIFGLSKLFPKSKRFGQYHLGHLSEHETNEVDILSGAFMFLRAEVLEKVGLLDEAFFMYGEDIDLSYRIVKNGYKNYYFPETRIIHYKGESTKKSSVNYVFVFYRAMVIFAQKHFSQKHAGTFSLLINAAIYIRAGLAILTRFIRRITLPLVDALLLLLGLFALTNRWRMHHIEFPDAIIKVALPIYTLIWVLSVVFSSGYDKPIKLLRFLKGTVFGTVILLIAYGLLPKEWQFSRLFILLGTIWVVSYYLISRVFLHFSVGKSFRLFHMQSKRFAIVGDKEESARVKEILEQSNSSIERIEFVVTSTKNSKWASGTINQLDQIAHIRKVDEIIFCAKNTSAETIINWMSKIDASKVDFKIAQPESLYLIGSNSIDTAGDLYVLNINSIATQENKRNKRTFDVIVATLLCIASPIFIWFYSNKKTFLKNMLRTIIGKVAIVGYSIDIEQSAVGLPHLKPGVLHPMDSISSQEAQLRDKVNLIYARDYSIQKDAAILWKSYRKLDRGLG